MQSEKSSETSKLIAAGVSRIFQEGSQAVLVTVLEVPAGIGMVGLKILVEASGEKIGSLEVAGEGESESGALDAGVAAKAVTFLKSREDTRVFRVQDFAPELEAWGQTKLLFERLQAEPRLVICGAGHVGAALARIASLLGYRTTLIDDRQEFLEREQFPDSGIELLQANKWREAVQQAVGDGKGVSVAIVTRGHSEDEECLHAVIDVTPDYVGLIGSKRRTNIVLQRLRDSGASEESLRAVHAPVGLDIGAVTPEEVALAIMAEIVSVRRGGEGGSLSRWRRGR